MIEYFARICWNSSGWKRPTGDAAKIEGKTFVSQNGFGFDEWLFDPGADWNGWQYGFLQPVHKGHSQRAGSTISVVLFTVPGGGRDQRQVIAVEGDIERAHRDIDGLVLGDRRCDAVRERDATALDADEQQPLGTCLLLDDLVREADRRPTDLVGGHDPASGHPAFLASLGHAGDLTGPRVKGQTRGYREGGAERAPRPEESA